MLHFSFLMLFGAALSTAVSIENDFVNSINFETTTFDSVRDNTDPPQTDGYGEDVFERSTLDPVLSGPANAEQRGPSRERMTQSRFLRNLSKFQETSVTEDDLTPKTEQRLKMKKIIRKNISNDNVGVDFEETQVGPTWSQIISNENSLNQYATKEKNAESILESADVDSNDSLLETTDRNVQLLSAPSVKYHETADEFTSHIRTEENDKLKSSQYFEDNFGKDLNGNQRNIVRRKTNIQDIPYPNLSQYQNIELKKTSYDGRIVPGMQNYRMKQQNRNHVNKLNTREPKILKQDNNFNGHQRVVNSNTQRKRINRHKYGRKNKPQRENSVDIHNSVNGTSGKDGKQFFGPVIPVGFPHPNGPINVHRGFPGPHVRIHHGPAHSIPAPHFQNPIPQMPIFHNVHPQTHARPPHVRVHQTIRTPIRGVPVQTLPHPSVRPNYHHLVPANQHNRVALRQYNYGYNVGSDHHGTHFGHTESNNGQTTKGSYFVDLPDGRRMVVNYEADRNGYRPQITYEQRPTPVVVQQHNHNIGPATDVITPGPVLHNIGPASHNIRPVHHNIGPAPHNIGPAPHNIGPAPHNIGPVHHNIGPVHHNIGPVHHNIGPAPHNIGPVHHNIGPAPHNIGPVHHNIGPSPHIIVNQDHQPPAWRPTVLPNVIHGPFIHNDRINEHNFPTPNVLGRDPHQNNIGPFLPSNRPIVPNEITISSTPGVSNNRPFSVNRGPGIPTGFNHGWVPVNAPNRPWITSSAPFDPYTPISSVPNSLNPGYTNVLVGNSRPHFQPHHQHIPHSNNQFQPTSTSNSGTAFHVTDEQRGPIDITNQNENPRVIYEEEIITSALNSNPVEPVLNTIQENIDEVTEKQPANFITIVRRQEELPQNNGHIAPTTTRPTTLVTVIREEGPNGTMEKRRVSLQPTFAIGLNRRYASTN